MFRTPPRAARLLPWLLLTACGGGPSPGGPPPGGAFLHTQGTEIVDGDGNPVFLKGVSFGNEVWANRALPDDHAEIDFQRLADMGANSTRFLLNYVTFEDDAAPDVYKDAGWAWIDQNVAWAKAHGIYLILNMHVPQGGFQSNGEGGALWSDTANQDRLTALWKAIARRYADEPIIAGFDLVNEPEPAGQPPAVAGPGVENHRRDPHRRHEPHGVRRADHRGRRQLQLRREHESVHLDDTNIVYEFHFYDPSDYTFQLQPWNNTPDGGAYPDPTKIAGVTEQWINLATFDAPTAPAGTSDWTHYEGTRITATGTGIAVGKPTLVGQALGAGTIAFDDLTIKEYDAAGTFTREVAHIFPTTAAAGTSGRRTTSAAAATASGCKTSATCLTITGTTDDASWGGYAFYFVPTQGYQYSVSGWMKGTNLPAGAIARMRLDLVGSSTPVRVRDKAGLRDMMAPYLAWGTTHDVPLFLGEFGVYKACFANDKGGLAWVGDVYDLATGDGAAGARASRRCRSTSTTRTRSRFTTAPARSIPPTRTSRSSIC